MAAFPTVPRVVVVELFVNNGWADISSDVYARGKIVITRGRANEQVTAAPSSCQLLINNRSGNYSPRNPVSPYYGSLGRNTPLRVSVQLGSDLFTRTVSNGWGSMDTGQVYTSAGFGGTVNASDFNVAAGAGTISIPVANAGRDMLLTTVNLRDVDLAVTVSIPFTAITGASIFPVILIARRDNTTNAYAYLSTVINTAGVISVSAAHTDGTLIIPTTATGLTHSSLQALRVRFQVEGDTYRAKCWAAAGPEPYVWTATGHYSGETVAGSVGLYGQVSAGNTNTFPVVFSYDALTVQVPRFAGEVAGWPQGWDITGNDAYVSIDASGITRRLGQGAAPLRSALYRYYTQLTTPPVAYWPCEDPSASVECASAIGGAPFIPGLTTSGTQPIINNTFGTVFSSYTGIPSSDPLPVLSNTGTSAGFAISPAFNGSIPAYTATSQTMLRFLLHIPIGLFTAAGSEPTDGTVDIATTTNYSLENWSIIYRTGGLVSLSHNSTDITGPINYGDIRGRNMLFSLQLTQSGADTLWNLGLLEVGAPFGLQLTNTLVSSSIGTLYQLSLNSFGDLVGSAIGHVSVRTTNVLFSDIITQVTGYAGEAAGIRAKRLCAEQGVPFSWRGDLATTTLMGPQDAGSSSGNTSLSAASVGQTQLLTILNQVQSVDMGTLYEPRGDIGVAYRTRADAYNQAAQLGLDYAIGQVAPPFTPIDDDQLTRNNIIVTRINAGSAEAELTLGRMSTLSPAAGGVGRYDTQYTLNVATDDQLPNLASWLLILGTTDEARYPIITVNLANPQTTSLESATLGVDMDDRITVINAPPGLTHDQITQLVRGYTETIGPFEHTIAFNCSPETPYEVAQVGSTPAYKIDSSTSSLASGATATATTLSVANVSQPWTTDPTQMPIRIIIAGEQMAITAITGTTSPQTFTVTRSTNGVVKTQSAGAVVQVFRFIRPIIGL